MLKIGGAKPHLSAQTASNLIENHGLPIHMGGLAEISLSCRLVGGGPETITYILGCATFTSASLDAQLSNPDDSDTCTIR